MIKKWYSFLPAFVFLAFIGIMTLVLFLSPARDYSENEKRNLTTDPNLSISAFLEGTAQGDLESFTADQVPGRDFYVGVNAYWKLLTGRNASQSIYHCKDDYLINAPDKDDGVTFDTNLQRFDAFAQSLGIPADIMMVPSTGYIMEDVLPSAHGDYHDDALYERAENILSYVNILDLRQVLKDGAKEQQVCYRTDHHLTAYGNYLMYRTYGTHLGKDIPNPDDYDIFPFDGFYGTTWSGSGYWFTPADIVEIWQRYLDVTVTLQDGGAEPVVSTDLYFTERLDQMDKYPVYLDGNHSFVTIENPYATGGTVVIVRDSYAHCLSTFMAENFRTLYLVDLRYYRDSLSAFLQEHPADRLLYVYGMDSLLTDTNSAWLS